MTDELGPSTVLGGKNCTTGERKGQKLQKGMCLERAADMTARYRRGPVGCRRRSMGWSYRNQGANNLHAFVVQLHIQILLYCTYI